MEENHGAQGVRSSDTLYGRSSRRDLLYRVPWGKLAVAAGVLTLVGLLFTALAGSPLRPRAPFHFGLVVDAGSSHSELTLYRWAQPKFRGTGRVEEESHVSMEDGISSLGPRAAGSALAASMGPILSKAPANTPVYLGATAGMRLLNISNPDRSDALFLSIECSLRNFSLRQASILTGQQEGLFAWLSVNYLLDAFLDETPETLGALDMGGASTQIAFQADTPNSIHLKLYGRDYGVASRSYLCFGVNEAMRRFLARLVEQGNFATTVESPCHNEGLSFNRSADDLFGSPCTQTRATIRWLQNNDGNTTFTFVGKSSGQKCYEAVTDMMGPHGCHLVYKECVDPMVPAVPTNQKFVAFSAYYYLMKALNSTNTSMGGFLNASYTLCSSTWNVALTMGIPKKYLPAYCFQSMYMHDLLAEKYGFTADTWHNLAFLKHARGFNVGWSLGFMINATNAIPESAPPKPMITGAALGVMIFLCIVLFLVSAVAGFMARLHRRAHQYPTP
ncbi:ectonucleoside triphosphate diphosphohydrolase 2-like [Ornithodoros turicata]|uniref:ectonucleoside triphosphate diphosphohydrolase 2-like n=1 Tax=Ornithodoros turicata TaxID=34597 RepID=UPI003138FDF5